MQELKTKWYFCINASLTMSHQNHFDYANIMRVTDTSKDAEYQNSKRDLKENYQQLKNEN